MPAAQEHRFRFTVLGRYPAHLRDNQTSVTVSMAAGAGDHLVHCGTLTMAEDEWETFVEALGGPLADRLEIVDQG